jgi:hypothetical protein
MPDDLAQAQADLAAFEALVARRRELTAEWMELEGLIRRSDACPHCGRALTVEPAEAAAVAATTAVAARRTP